jgi:hypothetical protein
MILHQLHFMILHLLLVNADVRVVLALFPELLVNA